MTPETPAPVRFHPFVTFLCWLIVLFTFLLISIFSFTAHPLDLVKSPEKSLSLVGERSIELLEARARLPLWENRFYTLYNGLSNREEETDEIIKWNEEMANYSHEPATQIHLAVLEGETGRLDKLEKRTALWKNLREPLPRLAPLIQSAYLETPLPEDGLAYKPILKEVLAPGWFRSRLLEKLARKTGETSFADRIARTLSLESTKLLQRYRRLVLLDLSLGALFYTALFLFIKRRSETWRIGAAPLPPMWRGRTAATVLVRGAAVGSLISFGFLFFSRADGPFGELLSSVLASLPVILLGYRHLIAPYGLSFRQGFGLSLPTGQLKRLIFITLTGMGIDLFGGWTISLLSGYLNLPNHWVESFDSSIVWGNSLWLAGGLIGNVLFAPFSEELIFRGFLYGSLRRKFGWLLSAVLSAGVFSALHGYGAMGFLTVFWSGAVWAWMYEKSGSLLPGMIGHAFNNLVFSATLIVMLRI